MILIAYDASLDAKAAIRTALARDAGLDAAPSCRARETTMANAILDEVDQVGAIAIVMGSRGLSGLKSLFPGSVSHAVVQHADRPVIVVPSPEVAASRVRARHALQRG
jgi:nucleotide-binding universal stress UspA family protein